VQYNFSEIFDDEKSYELWAYNIETVMAEKVETILRRGVTERTTSLHSGSSDSVQNREAELHDFEARKRELKLSH